MNMVADTTEFTKAFRNVSENIRNLTDSFCGMAERKRLQAKVDELTRHNAQLVKDNQQLQHELRKWRPR